MEKEFLFAIISTGLYLIGAIPLWRDIVSGRTIPHIFTYGLWWVLVSFNWYVLFGNGEFYSLIPTSLMILSLTFGGMYGLLGFKKVNINWFDWLCLGLGILLIFYWWISKNILETVILTAVLDLIAFLPTFKKGWLSPWTESILVYMMSSIGQVAILFSLSGFQNLENTIFWFYLFFANLIFFFMVAFRRYYLKGWRSIFE